MCVMSMSKLFLFLYNVFIIPPFFLLAHCAGLFNKKIRKGIKGRKNNLKNLELRINKWDPNSKRVWIHVSSMGEFEQIRALLALLKTSRSDVQIIITFFSPSGYDYAKIEGENMLKAYIPFDSWFQAKKFISLIKPDLAMVVRHDVWPNHQWRLVKQGIPSFLINASVSGNHKSSFIYLQKVYKMVYSTFDYLLTVSPENKSLLKLAFPEPDNILVTGDTKYDQVYNRTMEKGKIDTLITPGFFPRHKTIVLGNVWPADLCWFYEPLYELLRDDDQYKVVIAHHELSENHLKEAEDFFAGKNMATARYTQLGAPDTWKFKVLIIDTFGILANLYALGHIAYVGGGFGVGVHNVLEPAAHGACVLYGPNFTNQTEADEMVKQDIALVIKDQRSVEQFMKQMKKNPEYVSEQGNKAKNFVMQNVGSSEKVLNLMQKYL